MSEGINITATLVANILGLSLMAMILVGNSWRLRERNADNTFILSITVLILISCILDPLAAIADGVSGFLGTVGYVANWLLYFTNLVLMPSWIYFLCHHLNYQLPRWHRMLIVAVEAVGTVLLIVTVFTPVVFGYDDTNHYFRGPGYWFFLIVQIALLADSILIYFIVRRHGGMLKFFPVWLFALPVLLGVALQSMFYGISTIWPFIAVSVGGLMASLQNELIFRDKLTGLYNRFYLDYLKDEVARVGSGNFTAMMLDLNGFKSINDTYGHHTGDEALVDVARILTRTVNTLGVALRYAGDEFVVLLNTHDDELAQKTTDNILAAFEDFNENGGKIYNLSVAIGSSKLDMMEQSVDEVINEVDRRMYENKRAYYLAHPSRDRRGERKSDR